MSITLHNEILRILTNAKHIALVSHIKPDGDALGSVLALAHYLEAKQIPATLYNHDAVGDNFNFLPKAHLVGSHAQLWERADLDVIVLLDCSSLGHSGVAEQIKQQRTRTTIINIDHHASNDYYGHINYVSSRASSTCELVFQLLSTAKYFNKIIAQCLLTGLITDTGGFSNLATTPQSIKIAGQLLNYGINLPALSKTVLQKRSFNTLKLWGRALERLYEDPKTHFITTVITLADTQELNVTDEAISGIANFLNSLEDASNKAVLVLSQTKVNVIKGSLRTTSPLLDVTTFAKLYGGGGHKKAAGFTLTGTLTYTNHDYTITH
ncbi:MAG: DHH family phosphoesterase [Patescibacteria group bacterium]|jgi:phosphoesterase RecJ-like protein